MTGRLQRQNARCASAFKRWAPITRRLCGRKTASQILNPPPLEHGQGAGGGDAREVCGRQAQSLDRTHVPVIVFAPPSSCSPPTACSRRPRCTCPPHPTTARLAASRARVAPCGARCPDASSAADLRAKPAEEEMADAGVGAWGDEGRMVRRFSFVLTRRRESCAATRLLCPPTHSRTRCPRLFLRLSCSRHHSSASPSPAALQIRPQWLARPRCRAMETAWPALASSAVAPDSHAPPSRAASTCRLHANAPAAQARAHFTCRRRVMRA